MSKVRLTFKTPDVEDQIDDQMEEQTKELGYDARQQTLSVIRKFVRHGEYVTIEFDIKERTCEVIEA